MKIVVTGASGYVGQNIIPLLRDRCEDLVLVGRNPERLRDLFPGAQCCRLDELYGYARGFDCLVNLAVRNTNKSGDYDDFYKINAEHTHNTAKIAKSCNIKVFYNISSIHALDEGNKSNYAKSKRAAVELLRGLDGIKVINVYIPFVKGDKWGGKLVLLNKLPKKVQRALQPILLAIKPSVRAESIVERIIQEHPEKCEIIISEGQSKNVFFRTFKRGVDILFALSVIGLLWWALFIVWASVKLGSPGPGIFSQERVGRYGKTFICYKFRTMRQGTLQAGTHEISQSSVTPIGKFLRATKFDELPQVWNILRNEISLIGPRPSLPMQTELFEARQAKGVFDIKPGISGLAQVNKIDMSDAERIATWDAKYVALQSIALDTKILIATIMFSGRGDNTYEEKKGVQ